MDNYNRLVAAVDRDIRASIPDGLPQPATIDAERSLGRVAEHVARHLTAGWTRLGHGRLLLVPADLEPTATITTADGTVVNAYANLPDQ